MNCGLINKFSCSLSVSEMISRFHLPHLLRDFSIGHRSVLRIGVEEKKCSCVVASIK